MVPLLDRSDPDPVPDLRWIDPPTVCGWCRSESEVGLEECLEHNARALERCRIHIGNVVADDVEFTGVGVEPCQTDEQ